MDVITYRYPNLRLSVVVKQNKAVCIFRETYLRYYSNTTYEIRGTRRWQFRGLLALCNSLRCALFFLNNMIVIIRMITYGTECYTRELFHGSIIKNIYQGVWQLYSRLHTSVWPEDAPGSYVSHCVWAGSDPWWPDNRQSTPSRRVKWLYTRFALCCALLWFNRQVTHMLYCWFTCTV